jgi:type III secretory pathway component EscV
VAKSSEEIANLLKHTKFKRRWFGGVDEEDVWVKLGRLQEEYSELIKEVKRQSDAAAEEAMQNRRQDETSQ